MERALSNNSNRSIASSVAGAILTAVTTVLRDNSRHLPRQMRVGRPRARIAALKSPARSSEGGYRWSDGDIYNTASKTTGVCFMGCSISITLLNTYDLATQEQIFRIIGFCVQQQASCLGRYLLDWHAQRCIVEFEASSRDVQPERGRR